MPVQVLENKNYWQKTITLFEYLGGNVCWNNSNTILYLHSLSSVRPFQLSVQSAHPRLHWAWPPELRRHSAVFQFVLKIPYQVLFSSLSLSDVHVASLAKPWLHKQESQEGRRKRSPEFHSLSCGCVMLDILLVVCGGWFFLSGLYAICIHWAESSSDDIEEALFRPSRTPALVVPQQEDW